MYFQMKSEAARKFWEKIIFCWGWERIAFIFEQSHGKAKEHCYLKRIAQNSLQFLQFQPSVS